MQFGLSQVGDEGSDQHGRLSLTDERRCSSDNGLSTGDAHRPEEEDCEFADKPLDDAPVEQELHECNEEDDGREDTEEEELLVGNLVGSQERNTISRKAQKLTRESRDEVEDVITSLGPQHEKRNDELREHADNDSVPDNLAPVSGSGPETEEKDEQTEQTDGTVRPSVVFSFRARERAHNDSSYGYESAKRQAHFLRDQRSDPNTRVVPNPMHRACDDADGDMEKDQAEHDGQPEEKGNDPVLVMAMNNDTGNPPTAACQFTWLGYIRQPLNFSQSVPGEKHANEDVYEDAKLAVVAGVFVSLGISLFGNAIGVGVLLQAAMFSLVVAASRLLNIQLFSLRMVQTMERIVVGILCGDDARLVERGALGVGDLLIGELGVSVGTMVKMAVVVLVCNVQRRVGVLDNTRHGGAVVLA